MSLPPSAVKLSTWQWLAGSTPALLPNIDYSILPAFTAVAVLPRLPCIPVVTLGPRATLGWAVASDLCSHQASCSQAPATSQVATCLMHLQPAHFQLVSFSTTHAKPPGPCRTGTSTTGVSTPGNSRPCSLDAVTLPCSKCHLSLGHQWLYPYPIPPSSQSWEAIGPACGRLLGLAYTLDFFCLLHCCSQT